MKAQLGFSGYKQGVKCRDRGGLSWKWNLTRNQGQDSRRVGPPGGQTGREVWVQGSSLPFTPRVLSPNKLSEQVWADSVALLPFLLTLVLFPIERERLFGSRVLIQGSS